MARGFTGETEWLVWGWSGPARVVVVATEKCGGRPGQLWDQVGCAGCVWPQRPRRCVLLVRAKSERSPWQNPVGEAIGGLGRQFRGHFTRRRTREAARWRVVSLEGPLAYEGG